MVSTGNPPTVKKRDCPVANAIRFFKWRPRSRSKPTLAHCSWKIWNVFSAPRHFAVIWASARSELRSFAPSEFTRTKISVTSSYDSVRSRMSIR